MRPTGVIAISNSYRQISGARNPEYRKVFVQDTLARLRPTVPGAKSILDVGAGTGPFRDLSESLGFVYTSHDFGEYLPSDESPALQNKDWAYTELDLRCDLLEIPQSSSADVVMCTEVLEHVADPVKALQKLVNLTRPNGALIVTVPFLSLMHQAPYWFSAGLSPYWFAHHLSEFEIIDFEIVVHGDYFDFMYQEINRLFDFPGRIGRFASYPIRVLCGLLLKIAKQVLPSRVRELAGHGVTVVAKKPGADWSSGGP